MTEYPQDLNRAGRQARAKQLGDGTQVPAALRVATMLFTLAAILAIGSALVGLFATPDAGTGEVADFVHGNRRFVSILNIIGGIVIAAFAPQMSRPLKHARTVLAVTVFIVSFANIAAIAIGIGGLFLVAVPVLLMAATYAMFRPAANEFVRAGTYRPFDSY